VSKPAIHIVDFNPASSGNLCGRGSLRRGAEAWYGVDSRTVAPRFAMAHIRRSKRICGLCRRIMLARAKARGR
jgi:hypothetical protein